MTNYSNDVYKVVKVPANISIDGKDKFHVLRNSYENIPGTITIKDCISKKEADQLKTTLQNNCPVS